MTYDFSGWATKNNLRCSDGRTILKDAFKDCDGLTVPLVWNHDHNQPENVLGHALLENRNEGVYTYCTFNDTESGNNAKKLVQHGDITSLSIYANQLKQSGGKNDRQVIHGVIREVSLVLAGANPGAYIDSIVAHSDDISDDDYLEMQFKSEEAQIYTGEDIEVNNHISHADEAEELKPEAKAPAEESKDSGDDETLQDVFDTLSEKQKQAVYAIIGLATQDNEKNNGGEENMKHNVFENGNESKEEVLTHSDMEAIFTDARRYGSLKDSVLAHGITDIDILFPDAKTMETPPDFIKREDAWVRNVMSATHHTPFSRIKSIHADITADDARALGYIKGNLKKDEVFTLLKRTTTPTTIYKKQKLDRDDVIDITDFDVVAWIKSEMRTMLDEEIARAILVGDGRLSSSDDKISETNIRPVWTDADLYTIKTVTDDATPKAFIRAAIKARKNYKGSGTPTLYTTEDMLTDMLLMEDTTGRVIYDSVDKLATALRVKEIVTVPVMEGLTRTVGSDTNTLEGIIVNLADYNVGADKGGDVNMFDDFDIDYNAQKYLIETRCSGALIKPYSAIAIETTSVTQA